MVKMKQEWEKEFGWEVILNRPGRKGFSRAR